MDSYPYFEYGRPITKQTVGKYRLYSFLERPHPMANSTSGFEQRDNLVLILANIKSGRSYILDGRISNDIERELIFTAIGFLYDKLKEDRKICAKILADFIRPDEKNMVRVL